MGLLDDIIGCTFTRGEARAACEAARLERQTLANENAANRRAELAYRQQQQLAAGQTVGVQSTWAGFGLLHGQGTGSANRFFGTAPGQTSGGALAGLGVGAEPNANGGSEYIPPDLTFASVLGGGAAGASGLPSWAPLALVAAGVVWVMR